MNIEVPWPTEQPPKPTSSEMLIGWHSHEDEFARIFNELGVMPTMIEIGSFHGKTAHHLLSTYKDLTLYCIDPWANYSELKRYDLPVAFESWQHSLWPFRERVHAIRMKSVDGLIALRQIISGIKIIYIDGAHDYISVMSDIIVANVCFPDALICGDDYGNITSVRKAVNEYAREKHLKVRLSANKKFWQFTR